MKRIFSFAAAVILLLGLSACNAALDLKAEAEPYIVQMLTALAEEDLDTASGLLHPEVTDTAGLQELVSSLGGRGVKSCAVQSLNINSHSGTGGKVKTESGTALVTLEDGAVMQLQYIFKTTDKGAGFSSFRFSVGV